MLTAATPPTQQFARHLHLRLIGQPIPKARPRVVRRDGQKPHSYTPDKTTAGTLAWQMLFKQSGALPLPPNRPLALRVLFVMTRPPSAPKKRTRPMVGSDIDNLLKLVTDALQGLAFDNDSRIVTVTADKVYAVYPTEPHTWLGIDVID